MFKFSFQPEELNEEFNTGILDETPVETTSNTEAPIPCIDFVELHPTAEQLAQTPDQIKHGIIIFAGGQEVLHLNQDVLIENLIEEEIQNRITTEQKKRRKDEEATDKHQRRDAHSTDLIPGVYEGGGKIWECTQDLGDFLTKSQSESTADDDDDDKGDLPAKDESLFSDLSGKNVLDLGCGAGILGLLALRAGATVHFQDYNPEVMSKVTIPNALLNTHGDGQAESLKRCRFYAGDWSKYVTATAAAGGPLFDIILTSETIYNPANNQKILDVLRRKMKPETGVTYLAAKTYYFGVGGGLREFETLMKTNNHLHSTVVWKSSENVQREILKITHKP